MKVKVRTGYAHVTGGFAHKEGEIIEIPDDEYQQLTQKFEVVKEVIVKPVVEVPFEPVIEVAEEVIVEEKAIDEDDVINRAILDSKKGVSVIKARRVKKVIEEPAPRRRIKE